MLAGPKSQVCTVLREVTHTGSHCGTLHFSPRDFWNLWSREQVMSLSMRKSLQWKKAGECRKMILECGYAVACDLLVCDVRGRGVRGVLRRYREWGRKWCQQGLRWEGVRALLGAGIQDTSEGCAVLPLLNRAVNIVTKQAKRRLVKEKLIGKNWVESCGCQIKSWQMGQA